MIILNPSSGGEKAHQFEEEVSNVLTELGYELIIRETKQENDATRFAENACKTGVKIITVLGGDGTISEIINGISRYEHRPALHIIPLGTVNNFARALDIPLRPRKAIEIIKNPVERKVDLGKVNEQYFMNLVNLGAVAEATYEVTPEQKSKLGAIAYFLEGVKRFSDKELFSATVITENDSKEVEAMLILITVTDTVAGIKHIIKEAEVKDGYLHVFAFKEMTSLEGLSILTNLINGSLKEQEQVKYWKAKSIHIQTTPQKVANVDGDEGEITPLRFEILEKHLTVLT